ncbi:MAG: sigma-70 family RNA polymerase sigma factor [Planctomycetota bacterium]
MAAPDPAYLIENAEFVRRLAIRLVGDPGAAEDVAQDVYLRALRSPPRTTERLRGWFARVTHNVVRQSRRGEWRRSRRERRAAAPEAVSGADEIAQHTEMLQRIARLVHELPKPQRRIVWLRFYLGLSHQEIAEREQVSPATSRSRVTRAVQHLRAELDRECGGRIRWLGVLAPLTFPRPAEAAAGALVLGGVLMKTKSFVATLLIVLIGGWLWWSESRDSTPSSPTSEVVSREGSPTDLSSVATSPASRILSAEGADESTVRSVALAASHVMGRCLDERGQPVVGAVVEWDVHAEPAPPSMTSVTTDEHGRFDWPIPIERGSEGRTVYLRIKARWKETSQASCWGPRGESTWLRDLVVPDGGEVSGRVLDSLGNGIAGARVIVREPWLEKDARHGSLWGPSGFELARDSAVSAPDGRFRLTGLPAGDREVWAVAEGFRYGSRLIRVAEAAGVDDVVLVLDRLRSEDTVTGVVLDPSGQPVPEARLRPSVPSDFGGSSRSVVCNEQGRFVIRVGLSGVQLIEVEDPLGRWPGFLVTESLASGDDVTLRFQEGRRVRVEAVDPEGRPVGIGRVDCARLNALGLFTRVSSWVTSIPPHESSPSLVIPDGKIRFEVQAGFHYGRREQWTSVMDAESCPEVVRVELERCPMIRGTVTGVNGDAIAGARIEAWSGFDSERPMLVNEYPCQTRMRLREARALAGDDGAFEMAVPGDGPYWILAESEGFARTRIGPVTPDPKGCAVILTVGGRLEGRVRTRDGSDPTGLVVVVDSGDGKPRSRRVGPDGEYSFDHLAPGTWRVGLHDRDVHPPVRRFLAKGDERSGRQRTVRIEDAATTSLDLVHAGPAGFLLEGVLHVPLLGATWKARASIPHGSFQFRVTSWIDVGPEGRFSFDLDRPGKVRIELRSEGVSYDWTIEEWITLEGPVTLWAFESGVSRVSGSVSDGSVRRVFVRAERGEVRVTVTAPVDETGRFDLSAPVGETELHLGRLHRAIEVEADRAIAIDGDSWK